MVKIAYYHKTNKLKRREVYQNKENPLYKSHRTFSHRISKSFWWTLE